MEFKTYPSRCPNSPNEKHEWESIVIGGQWVMKPLVWGETRRIQCKHCLKPREHTGSMETNDWVWEE